MFKTLKNAWSIPEMRSKLLYTIIIVLLYRVGAVIHVPFTNVEAIGGTLDLSGGSLFTYMNLLSGDAFSKATLFALSISPYITASIVMQLLAIAIPALERLSKSGEEGQKKITMITRFVTVGLAFLTAFGYYLYLKNSTNLLTDAGKTVLGGFVIVFAYTAGASLIMWLAEKINENGLGNGISMILFFNIICSLPNTVAQLISMISVGFGASIGKGFGALGLALFVVLGLLAMTFFIIFVTGSERRVPVQYAKRVVGRKMYGGQSTNLPLQLNMAGVMPVIFASSLVSLPTTILVLCGVTAETEGFWGGFYKVFDPNWFVYPILLFVLIIAFGYFYITISFNPVEVANNLKKNGGMIPGIRQGRPTAEYIARILSKITLMGALFLSIIAILPIIARPLVIEPVITAVTSAGTASALATSFTFGGTSVLIVVGIALETAREVEAQLTMRNYKGFL